MPKKHVTKNKLDLTFLLILFLSIPLLGFPLLTSYRQTPQGLVFRNAHDSLWHIAIIQKLEQSIPPDHPVVAGYKLENYHFLSDLFLLFVKKVFFLPTWFVYYRIGPVLAVFLFVTASFLVIKKLIKTKNLQYLTLCLILFSGSASWVPKIIGLQNHWHANMFMLDQPFDMLSNVHTYFGFGLFMLGLLFLLRNSDHLPKTSCFYCHSGKGRYKQVLSGILYSGRLSQIYAGIIFGLTFSIKAYASFVALAGLFAASIWQSVKQKKFHLLVYSFLPALMIAGFLYQLNSSQSSSAGLTFAPGWTLDKMIEDSDRVAFLPKLTLTKQVFVATGNTKRLVLHYLILFSIYLLGNLGVRLFGLLLFIWWITKPKKLVLWQVFVLVSFSVSLLTPIFFYQTNSAYNIVQFGQYALILASLSTGILIDRQNIIKPKTLTLALILILSLPTSFKTLHEYTLSTPDSDIVTYNQLSALNFLKNQTPKNSVTLTHPQSRNQRLMLIPSLANRQVYYSGSTFAPMTGIDDQSILEKQFQFFSLSTDIGFQKEFLTNAKINYIYLENSLSGEFKTINKQLNLKPVFENSDITVYQVD